jgi:hypothetical protein
VKTLVLAIALLSATSSVLPCALGATATVLEQKNTNGPGWLIEDLTVDGSGAVAVQKFQGPGQPLTPPKVIATLPGDQMSRILAEIAAIPAGELTQLDPHQSFNPGGFGAQYVLTRADGTSMEFARDVSGVEYGLPGNLGHELKDLLRKLSKLAQ